MRIPTSVVPAHWAPVVLQQLQHKEEAIVLPILRGWTRRRLQLILEKQWQEARANRRKQFKVGNFRDGDRESNICMLTGTIKADWTQLPVERYLAALPTLRHGVIVRIMVSLLLPGPMEMDQWLKDVRACINMWPLQKTAHVATNQMATEVFVRRERRRQQARHIWEKIEPDWPLIRARVWTKQATGLYDALHRRLFLHDHTEESRWLENSYRGPHWRWVQQQWKNCQAWFAGQAVARSPSQWISTLYLHGLDQLDALSWQWINQHENLVEPVWHTQQGTFRRKRPPDVRDDPMRRH